MQNEWDLKIKDIQHYVDEEKRMLREKTQIPITKQLRIGAQDFARLGSDFSAADSICSGHSSISIPKSCMSHKSGHDIMARRDKKILKDLINQEIRKVAEEQEMRKTHRLEKSSFGTDSEFQSS